MVCRRRLCLSMVILVLGFLLSSSLVLRAYMSDALSHPPPATGTYAFNTFVPPNTPGATYVDPVFGSTIRRLTADHQTDQIYTRNMWWNADGTLYFHNHTIISTQTGAVAYTNLPTGGNSDYGFDPIDPKVYFYGDRSGPNLRKVTLGAGGTFTDVLYLTVSSNLLSLGETINWLSADGRYMVLRYGPEPSVHVFDRQNLAAGAYAGATAGNDVDTGGYAGLTPDGKYVVDGRRSWPINHAARTVGGNGTFYWGLCGEHTAFMSASDGRDYAITANCYDYMEMWRVDITNDATGLSADAVKALPNNLRLVSLPAWTMDHHVATAAKGSLRDWAFMSIEDSADVFNGPVSPWSPYRSEIIAVNALTGEVRRLAHHRSRSTGSNDAVGYYYQPRVSSSWGGEFVGWASNYNQSGVVDVFATPFGGATTGIPSAPTNLRILP